MKITIIYSGFLSQITGIKREEIDIEENTTLEELLNTIYSKHHRLSEWVNRIPLIEVMVNGEPVYNPRKHVLREGDEVVLAPVLYEGG
ncbi:MAG: MoaD/ThiS family protein [Thermoprotei archaeon]